jgi:hypothetical protein
MAYLQFRELPPLTIATSYGPVAILLESDQLPSYAWGDTEEAIPFDMVYLQFRHEFGDCLASSIIAEAEHWARIQLSDIDAWLLRSAEHEED